MNSSGGAFNRRPAGRPTVGKRPEDYTLAELRLVMGSMFTTRFGPNDQGIDPHKIIIWGEFLHGRYSEAEFQLAIRRWKELRYTHCVVGPMIDETGYHGTVPATDFRRDTAGYLERFTRMWEAGIIPVLYCATDNWTLDQMRREVEPIYRRPEWQRVIRAVAPHGFEPSADTPNHEHVAWGQWGRDVFPNALCILHTVSDLDAPGNNDDFTPGSATFIGFAKAWHLVAPYYHQWHAQYGPFEGPPSAQPDIANEVRKLFPSRFKTGYAGWPTFSAFGNEPMDHIFGEYCSFTVWHDRTTEADARAWGDIAKAAGADGCFDGVNVA